MVDHIAYHNHTMEQSHERVVADVVLKKKKVNLKCIHDKHKHYCRICSPTSFCRHGRPKRSCIDCGTGRCLHKKIKTNCRVCSPCRYCIHDIVKWTCKECSPNSVCEHGKLKRQCTNCGTRRCLHNKTKSQCKECSPKTFCVHEVRKAACVECGGSSVCVHGRRKDTCRECPCCYMHLCKRPVAKSTGRTTAYQWKEIEKPETGTEIYNDLLASALLQKPEFNRAELDRFDQEFFYNTYIKVGEKFYTPAGTCSTCARAKQRSRFKGNERVLHYSLKRQGVTLTAAPRTGARKKKEMRILDVLDTSDISQVNDKTAENRDSTCERAEFRPDFQVKHANEELITIYIEVDENQHKRTTTACELSRLNDLLTSFQLQRHLVVLRYNPDPFNMGEKRVTCRELPRKEREDILMRELNQVIAQAADPANFKDILTVIYIAFDCDCTTPCGYVHIDRFADQNAIREAYDRAGL